MRSFRGGLYLRLNATITQLHVSFCCPSLLRNSPTNSQQFLGSIPASSETVKSEGAAHGAVLKKVHKKSTKVAVVCLIDRLEE
jgi:hypothetical protein